MTKSADMATLLDSNSKVPGADIAGTSLPVASINATGTPSASTFLRGDGSWQAAGGGQIQSQLFTATGSWTAPTGVTKVRAWIFGGGGGSAFNSYWGSYGFGGLGSYCVGDYTVTSGTSYTITVGVGGAGVAGSSNPTVTANAGGTSSFGALASAAGGGGGIATNGCNPYLAVNGSTSSGTLRNVGGTSYSGSPASVFSGNVLSTGTTTAATTWTTSMAAVPGARGNVTGGNSPKGGGSGIIYLEWVG